MKCLVLQNNIGSCEMCLMISEAWSSKVTVWPRAELSVWAPRARVNVPPPSARQWLGGGGTGKRASLP